MSLGQLVVELSLDGSEFTLNLKRADGQVAQFIQRSSPADQATRSATRPRSVNFTAFDSRL